jgi:hypothetical protein
MDVHDETPSGQPAPFRLIKSETVPLTRELAEEMRTMKPSPTERELSTKRVDYLRDRLRAGVFHPPHWVKAIVKGEEKPVRCNGQHTSDMLSKLNGEFPKGLVAHVDTFECDDISALALLFRQLDPRQSARTADDVSHAYQGLESDLNQVPPHVAKLGVEAIIWHRKRVEGLAVPRGDDQYTVFHEWEIHPFLIWLSQVLSLKTPEMNIGSVVASMYGAFRIDANAANLFWKEVARGGEEDESTTASAILDNWLMKRKQGEIWVSPLEMFQGCGFAWNAFRQNKEIREIKSDIRKSLIKLI